MRKSKIQLGTAKILAEALPGRTQSLSNLELLEAGRHRVVLVCFARLAPAPYPSVLADAPPSAILALAPLPSVLADARPSALLALAPYSSVLALPRLPPSCSLPSPAAPSLVSVWRRPLTPALSTLLLRSAPPA